jgi:hypothetical protein
MTLAIARLNVSGENGPEWLNDVGDPQSRMAKVADTAGCMRLDGSVNLLG